MFLDQYKKDITDLCQRHKVKSLYVFGSVLSNNFNPESDVDFIVDIDSNDPIEYAEHYFDFKFKLQEIVKKPIDLLEQKAIKNTYLKKKLNENKQVVYEA